MAQEESQLAISVQAITVTITSTVLLPQAPLLLPRKPLTQLTSNRGSQPLTIKHLQQPQEGTNTQAAVSSSTLITLIIEMVMLHLLRTRERSKEIITMKVKLLVISTMKCPLTRLLLKNHTRRRLIVRSRQTTKQKRMCQRVRQVIKATLKATPSIQTRESNIMEIKQLLTTKEILTTRRKEATRIRTSTAMARTTKTIKGLPSKVGRPKAPPPDNKSMTSNKMRETLSITHTMMRRKSTIKKLKITGTMTPPTLSQGRPLISRGEPHIMQSNMPVPLITKKMPNTNTELRVVEEFEDHPIKYKKRLREVGRSSRDLITRLYNRRRNFRQP